MQDLLSIFVKSMFIENMALHDDTFTERFAAGLRAVASEIRVEVANGLVTVDGPGQLGE